jgi:universal stress protein A
MHENGVICAIDVNDFDQDIVDLGAYFAKQFGVNLDIVHVTLFPDPTISTWPAFVGSPNLMIKDNRRLMLISTNVPGVEVRHHQLAGIASEKLLEFVEAHEPRLLVMGTHRRKGISKWLGSVASTMLRHAPCPVVVFRQRQNSQDFVNTKPEAIQ